VDFLQRVLWTEGLFLTPHHLQQVDRYHEHRVNSALRNIQPHFFGLTDLKIDEAALADGNLAIQRCKGVMPEGLFFNIPDFDEIPATRDVAHAFGTDRQALGVYIAIPVARAGFAAGGEEAAKEGIPPRFKSKEVRLIDAMGLTGDRQITVAMSNLRILFDGESLDGYAYLKIAQIGRTATGSFTLSDQFVPQSLFIGASTYIMNMLRHVLEILSTRSADLASQRRQRAEGLVDFTMSEAANFWLLNTVNGAIPPLMHMYKHGKAHPELLYVALAQIAGGLFTFSDLGHPKDIPIYNHEDLTATFSDLRGLLVRLLETVIPSHCVPIPLDRTPEGYFVGRVADEKLLKTGDFYLAVKSSAPDEKVVAEVPRKAKVTASNRIANLTAQFLRGLDLNYKSVPPKLIPVQPGCHYFQLLKQGDHWTAIEGSGAIGLYMPPEFTDLHLELMALKEQG